MDEKQIENLKAIAPNAIDENGCVKPFVEQLTDYALGVMPEGEVFVVLESIHPIHSQLTGGMPLVLSQHGAAKAAAALGISLKEFGDLPKWLENHPLVAESITSPNAVTIFIDVSGTKSSEKTAALTIDKSPVNGAYELSPNVTSLDPEKGLTTLLENSAKLGACIYVNSRTKSWLESIGKKLPAHTSGQIFNESDGTLIARNNDLDSVSTAEEAKERKGFWWSPSEQIAFWTGPEDGSEPKTWQRIDAVELSSALYGNISPDFVAAQLGMPDFSGLPVSALERSKDWEQMPENAAELKKWKSSVEARIDLSSSRQTKAVSPDEPTEQVPERNRPMKTSLFKTLSSHFGHDKQTARQDESRVQSQARGDDGSRPTRAAERDQ